MTTYTAAENLDFANAAWNLMLQAENDLWLAAQALEAFGDDESRDWFAAAEATLAEARDVYAEATKACVRDAQAAEAKRLDL